MGSPAALVQRGALCRGAEHGCGQEVPGTQSQQDLQKDLLSSSCFPNSHETTSCLGEQHGQALLSGADLPIARRPGLLFQTLFS